MTLDPAELTRLRGIALRQARGKVDAHTAEDLAQEAVVRFFVQDPCPPNPDAWICRVVTNLALDWLRLAEHSRRDGRPLEVGAASVPERQRLVGPSHFALLKGQVGTMLRSLPEKHATVLVLAAMGVPAAEIASRVGMASAQVVDQTLSRLRGRLREEFPDAADFLRDDRRY